MAGLTGLTTDEAMIKGDQPVVGVVTGIAGFWRGDMGRALALRTDTIVTTAATAIDLVVIDNINRTPGVIVMAGVT